MLDRNGEYSTLFSIDNDLKDDEEEEARARWSGWGSICGKSPESNFFNSISTLI